MFFNCVTKKFESNLFSLFENNEYFYQCLVMFHLSELWLLFAMLAEMGTSLNRSYLKADYIMFQCD